METVVITPDSAGKRNPFKSFMEFFFYIWYFRELIKVLTLRDLVSEVKKSVLGSAWIFITPVTGVLSWFILHYANVLKPGDTGVPYPAYVFLGSMVWGYFTGMFSSTGNTLQVYKPLISHLRFPRSILYFERIAVQSVNFSVSFCFAVVVLLLFGVKVSLMSLYVPFLLIPLILYALSLGIIASMMISISYEFRRVSSGIVGLLIYVMPVIYTRDSVENSLILRLIDVNPFTYIVCSIREMVFAGEFYDVKGYIVSSLLSVVLMFFALNLLEKKERKIVERLV